ncbi:uncharacterized protein LOC130716997 [Lotus japonicus]|uniref:uncharacterized protein LOC130716997 n=1 Tax=Lotus japonicus TaxID=34305 RepID=UPI00258520C2|nr:uncharacterized protein LOC130716997 [Lotus japonicus]
MEVLDLWPVFQKHGRVWDVFISSKRDQAGRRFGFVRFLDVKDSRKLEQDLDNIMIGKMKLHANLPRFSKPKRRMALPHGQNPERVQEPRAPAQWRVRQASQSYAQAVSQKGRVESVPASGSGPQPMTVKSQSLPLQAVEEWRGPEVLDGEEWMSRSLVGVIKDRDMATKLRGEAFLLRGFETVKVRFLGDDLALLTGPEGVDLSQLLHESRDWLAEVFVTTYPWSPLVAPDHRVTWVRCFGVPINMWTKLCLQELVAPLGELIAVDPQTESFTYLEFAKVQIRTKEPGVLSLCRKIKVRDAVFSVNIIEDMGSLGLGTCECSCSKCDKEVSVEGSLNLEVDDSNFSVSDEDHDM